MPVRGGISFFFCVAGALSWMRDQQHKRRSDFSALREVIAGDKRTCLMYRAAGDKRCRCQWVEKAQIKTASGHVSRLRWRNGAGVLNHVAAN